MTSNHYETLGLDMAATPSDIRAAVEKLEARARQSTASGAGDAQALWSRIRDIRSDLLENRAAREAYDLQVLAASDLGGPTGPVTKSAAVPSYSSPSRPRLLVAEAPARERQSLPLLPALLAAALVFLLITGVVLGRQFSHRPVSGSRPLPTVSGAVASTSAFTQGQHIVLHWTPVHGATAYRIQVSSGHGDVVRTATVQRPSYVVTVSGGKAYAWKVKARVHGRWSAYGHTSRFTVQRPALARPLPLLPASGALSGTHVQLCWGPVNGAHAYRLSISGLSTRTERTACTAVTLRPGKYVWHVRPVGESNGTYVGPASIGAAFTVRAHEGHSLVAAVSNTHATSHSKTVHRAHATSHSKAASHHASAHHGRAKTGHASTHRGRALVGHKSTHPTSGKTSSRTAHRIATQKASSTRSGKHGATHASHRSVRTSVHTRATAAATVKHPGHRHRVAPTTTSAHQPPPPPPPPVPVVHAAPTSTPGTAAVASAGSYTPSSAAVTTSAGYSSQSQIAGGASGSAVYVAPTIPPATPAPQVAVPAPQSSPAGSTSGGSTQDSHPQHPDHPDHPDHPVHPVHP